MAEPSSETLREEVSKAQDEARQAKADLEEGIKRVAALESHCGELHTDEQIRSLEDQIEELTEKLKRAEEALTYSLSPSNPDLESPKTQSDDEYIVVEQEAPDDLQNKLKEREVEIRKAIAHARRLEDMYNIAEEKTVTFERQVKVLEANMFEKLDDANGLLEKVKELEELLTAGQIQIAALEEKSKSCDEAQKKVEYEKVLFLETEDQLVKNFRKAHAEAEQYRNMIFQLETSLKVAEEKADSLEQELQMYRGREKKVDDDSRSVDEKTVVHEAISSHLIGNLQEVMDGDTSSLDLDMAHGRSDSIDEEMKFLGDNVLAHVKHSELLMTEFSNLQSAHILYACEAEVSKSQLEEHAKDLEVKISQLEQEMKACREKEDKMKQAVKVLEENASFFEGLKLSYADYTCNLEKRNVKLEGDLTTIRDEVAAHTIEEQKWTAECDRLRDVESRNALLEAQTIDLQTKLDAPRVCELCSQLQTQIQDLEAMLGELSLELQDSKRRELDVQREVKALEEKNASHEQLASKLEEESKSQFTNHSVKVQALEAQIGELQEQDSQSRTSIADHRLWAQEAASVLREHAESLHELREECSDAEGQLSTAVLLGEEEREALDASLKGLHQQFRDVQLSYGPEALQLCQQLLSLEKDYLKSQVVDMAFKCTSLGSEVESLRSQVQSLEKRPEKPTLEVRKSFREVSLDGEVQSLRAQVTELQSLRAQVSELPSLQARLEQMQLSLRAAETRELEQNLELVKAQRKVSAVQEEVCSVKNTLLNQTQMAELREEIDSLKQTLMKSEAENVSLREEIDVLVNYKTQVEDKLTDEVADKVTDEVTDKVTDEVTDKVTDEVTDKIMVAEASDSQQQSDVSPEKSKQKVRKRKNGKSAKASPPQEVPQTVPTTDRTHVSRHRIAVYLFSVVLIALVFRFSLR